MLGAGIPMTTKVVAYLQELSYVSKMTQGPVLVFEVQKVQDMHFTFPEPNSNPCDLQCSLSDVMKVWGRASIEYPKDKEGDFNKTRITKMWIKGRLLHPTKSKDQIWHWTSIDDPE
jgi:hypothetical protein